MKLNSISKVALILCCIAGTLFSTRISQAQGCIGMNDHVVWRTNADQDAAFIQYADSNTKYLRVGADWNVIEPTKGSYNAHYLDRIDYFFQKATAAGIRVLLTAAYAPAWANGDHAQGGWAPTADHLEDYADFCEYLLRRYTAPTYVNAAGQHTLEAIEIWNEPDLCDIFFKPYNRYSVDGATIYAKMVVAAGGRLQTVRPTIGDSDVLVLAPAVSSVHGVCWAPKGVPTWMDTFYGVPGITSKYDVFSWHTYWEGSGTTGWQPPELPPCWNPANQRQSVMGKLIAPDPAEIWTKVVANGDDKKPNWCTEIGAASRGDVPSHKPDSLLSLDEEKTHLTDAIATLRSGNVTNLNRIYWYELFDEPHAIKTQQVYGLLALNDTHPITYTGAQSLAGSTLTPKPAYAIYKAADKGVPAKFTLAKSTQVKANEAQPTPKVNDAPKVAIPQPLPAVAPVTALVPARNNDTAKPAPVANNGGVGATFSANFNDGKSAGWTATPNAWAAVEGQYQSRHNPAVSLSSVGDPNWKNYAAQARMKFSNGWKSGGIIARNGDAGGYYLRVNVNATIASHNLQLLKGTTVVSTVPMENLYDFKDFHTVKISVQDENGGTRVRGFIDDKQHLDYLDTTAAFAAGNLALRAEPWSGTISFDDVAVSPN